MWTQSRLSRVWPQTQIHPGDNDVYPLGPFALLPKLWKEPSQSCIANSISFSLRTPNIMSSTCGSLSHSNTFLRRLSPPCELESRRCYFLDSFMAKDGLGTRCWAMRYECKSLEALPLLNKAEKPPEKLFVFCPFLPPLFPYGMWTHAWR